ncbi:FG-GAP repeat protein [Candidatus Electronema sp. PJ]|uniref:FG-GAP repeat protein n=1 Tax=Candidatus Electronema sp. PJ TaxID=3401572 RepID=UPI003AA86B68
MNTPVNVQASAMMQKLLADDGTVFDQFGYSVAVSGETAVIGAYQKEEYTDNYYGSAYVFVQAADGKWSQQAKLTTDDGVGKSVSVSGNTAVVGAIADDSDSGSAYVFVRDADGKWSQQAKLTADDGAAHDWFGFSVAVSGNTAVIGALGDTDNGNQSGATYVFVRAADGTWTQQVKLLASDRAPGGLFGMSVAVSGDTAVIGDPSSDAAYIFIRAGGDTWMQQAKLRASDGAAGDLLFGRSVALSEDTAVIGAYGDDDKGSAYVFVRAADGTWTQQAKLLASDRLFDDSFGVSVAVSGDMAVIGASEDEYSKRGRSSGSAYIFVRAADSTWTQQAKLLAPEGTTNDRFGNSVAVSGDTVVIGTPWDNDAVYYASVGSAYVLRLPG